MSSLLTLHLRRALMTGFLALAACEPKPSSSPEPITPPEAEASARPTTAKPTSVLEVLEAVASHCKLDPLDHTPRDCDAGQLKALQKIVGVQRMKALPTLVDALEHEDVARRDVAGYAFKAYVPYILSDAAELDYTIRGEDKRVAPIDVALARRVLSAAQGYDADTDHLSQFTLDAAIDMGTLAGMDEEVRALLARFDPAQSKAQEQLYYQGMKRVMRFGRMRFFEDVKATLDHQIPTLQLIAFEGPQIMSSWNNAESDTVCTWAEERLREDVPRWNAGPARLLLRCNDANSWRNMLLDEATRRYNAGTLAQPFTSVLCRICAPPIHNQYPPGGKTVCSRGKGLFTRITIDEEQKLPIQERRSLLSCMVTQWSDSEVLEHLDLMKKSPDVNMSALAAKLIDAHSPAPKKDPPSDATRGPRK